MPAMPERIAVVLCNLGGPDSLESVRPFLFNLFSDPDIFRLPLGFLTQRPFAALIAWRRAPEATHGYAAIGGKSPILVHARPGRGAGQGARGRRRVRRARVHALLASAHR